MKIDFKKVRPATWARILFLIGSLINQVIAAIGAVYGDTSIVYQICSIVCTIVMSIICAWYNNDFTEIAIICGQIYEALKKKQVKIEVEEENDANSHQ